MELNLIKQHSTSSISVGEKVIIRYQGNVKKAATLYRQDRDIYYFVFLSVEFFVIYLLVVFKVNNDCWLKSLSQTYEMDRETVQMKMVWIKMAILEQCNYILQTCPSVCLVWRVCVCGCVCGCGCVHVTVCVLIAVLSHSHHSPIPTIPTILPFPPFPPFPPFSHSHHSLNSHHSHHSPVKLAIACILCTHFQSPPPFSGSIDLKSIPCQYWCMLTKYST